MRQRFSSQISRRTMLRALGAAGAAAMIPGAAFGQDSLADTFRSNQIMRNTDTAGNTAAAQSAIDTFEPILSYDTAYNLQLAILQYENIVAQGGWEEVTRDVIGMGLGHSGGTLRKVKHQLILTGDLHPDTREDEIFDQTVDAAIRRFQARHGLIITGRIDPETWYTLNVPADYRLAQLRLNAMRVEAMAADLADRYVVVNIPAALIERVETGTVVGRHTAIVGRIDRPTPILQSRIHQINFNPYWNVPKSIIRRDLIQFMNEDPEYLARYQIRIFDGAGNELNPQSIDWTTDEAVQYSFRQDPGAENSMGHVKINFHNPHSVYLHDTPQQGLFGENRRFHSSGCVRVENVDQMVAWLLRDNPNPWDVASVDATFNSGERLDVDIRNPVRILTTYISAWANRQGAVSFREDVYDYDAQGRVSFEA